MATVDDFFNPPQQRRQRQRQTYAVGVRIGEGAHSEVLREEGSPYCTKVARGGTVAAALNEVTLLTALSHPAIMRIVSVEYGDDYLAIRMPWYAVSLRQYCPLTGPTTVVPEVAVRLWAGIRDGLAYLHSRGVVHCDVKPENILVGEVGPVLADFGSAVVVGSPRTICEVQTLLYRAPEMTVGARVLPPVDVWSLGVVGLELVCGYRHTIRAGRTHADYVGDIAVLTGIPDWLGECLRLRPTERLRLGDATAPLVPNVPAGYSLDRRIEMLVMACRRDQTAVIAGAEVAKLITGRIPLMTAEEVDAVLSLSCRSSGVLLR